MLRIGIIWSVTEPFLRKPLTLSEVSALAKGEIYGGKGGKSINY